MTVPSRRHSTRSQRAADSASGIGGGRHAHLPAMDRPDPHPGELGLQLAFRPVAPADRRPLQRLGQAVDRHRSRPVLGQVRPRGRPTAPAPRCARHPARRLGQHDLVAEQPDDVALTAPVEPVAQLGRDAVAGVGHHDGMRQALGPDLVQQVQRELPLGLEAPAR